MFGAVYNKKNPPGQSMGGVLQDQVFMPGGRAMPTGRTPNYMSPEESSRVASGFGLRTGMQNPSVRQRGRPSRGDLSDDGAASFPRNASFQQQTVSPYDFPAEQKNGTTGSWCCPSSVSTICCTPGFSTKVNGNDLESGRQKPALRYSPEVRKRMVLLVLGVLFFVSQCVVWFPWLYAGFTGMDMLDNLSPVLWWTSAEASAGGGGRGGAGGIVGDDPQAISKAAIQEYLDMRFESWVDGSEKNNLDAEITGKQMNDEDRDVLLNFQQNSGIPEDVLKAFQEIKSRPFARASAFKASWDKDIESLRQRRAGTSTVKDLFIGEVHNPDRILRREAELASDPLLLVYDNVAKQHPHLAGKNSKEEEELMDYYVKVALRQEAQKAARRTDWRALKDEEEFPHHLMACKNGNDDANCTSDASFTLVLQLSWDRAWMLDPICRRWHAPVSAAIYVPEPDEHKFNPGSVGQECVHGARFHVEVDRRGGPSTYPVNRLRNAALSQVRTSHFLLADVDHWPMEGLAEQLQATAEKNPAQFASRYTAFVVPTFEHKDLSACDELKDDVPAMETCLEDFAMKESPKTFSDIKECYQSDTCIMYHEAFPYSHNTTNYPLLFQNPDPHYIRMYDCIQSERYEPYVVMRWSAALSAFDEMFVGYGLNKIQWLWTLRKVGFRYGVAPNTFLFHVKHIKSKARHVFRSGIHQKTNTKSPHMELVYTYASQLLQTYDEVEMAGRARVPICPPPVQDMIERPGPIRHPKETAAQT